MEPWVEPDLLLIFFPLIEAEPRGFSDVDFRCNGFTYAKQKVTTGTECRLNRSSRLEPLPPPQHHHLLPSSSAPREGPKRGEGGKGEIYVPL